MELSQGVFVSRISTDDWTEDPDLPGTEMHELVHEAGVWVGLTRILATDGPLPWMPDQRETATSSRARSGSSSRAVRHWTYGPGDIASFPAGLAMTWHVSTPFKELWFFG